MKTINLNELRDKAHKNAVEKGFWEQERPIESYLMLVICEIAEAVEADRKGKKAKVDKFKKTIEGEKTDIWYRIIFPQHFETYIKDTVEDEIADVAIRLLDLAGKFKVNLAESPYRELVYFRGDFAKSAYRLTKLMSSQGVDTRRNVLKELLYYIFSFAESRNIDLLWHIEQKMKYNETREYKHGKEY